MQELRKVLIVDDELMVRVGLRATIRWEEYGFQVIGACENGEQAIEEMDSCAPDVVFTDLKMPVMDGFVLIRYIRENHPDTKIIVLSCLDEVDAVKNAMKLGADDYILKLSLSADGLKALLYQLKDSMLQTKSQADKTELYPTEVEKKRQFYSTILESGMQESQQELLWQYSPKAKECRQFVVCCCAIHSTDSIGQDIASQALDHMLQEFFSELPFYENHLLADTKRMVLLGFADSHPHHLETVAAYWEKVRAVLKTHFNLTCFVAISQPFADLAQLHKRYSLTKECLSDSLFIGAEPVLCCAEPAVKRNISVSALALLLQSMVDSRNVAGAEAVICEWFNEMQQKVPPYSQYAIKAAVAGLCAVVAGYRPLSDAEAKLEQLGENDCFRYFYHAKTLQELEEQFLLAIRSFIETIAVVPKIHPEIFALKQYIAEHVEEEVPLAEAAKRCCLNKTYFCSLFKKEVGETYNEYCERIKMERARELLLSNRLKIYEVGLRVGIPNESYFSRRFKKHFGISPGQMRQRQT